MSRGILVVDDDVASADLMVDVLEHVGFSVVSARSVSDARAALARDPDLKVAVVDQRLGHEDGLALAQSLRESGLRALAISGDHAALRDAASAGFTVLPKPFGASELVAKVAAASNEDAGEGHRQPHERNQGGVQIAF